MNHSYKQFQNNTNTTSAERCVNFAPSIAYSVFLPFTTTGLFRNVPFLRFDDFLET